MFSDIVKILRPQQWCKNVFIFLPLFFSGNLTDGVKTLQCLVAFIAFCFISSAIYCINDICDVEYDRNHPVKKTRPLAQGRVSVSAVLTLSVAMLALSLCCLLMLDVGLRLGALFIVLSYYVLNLAYCFGLKRIALVDTTVVALCFVIRIVMGGYVSATPLTSWIIMMTFLLCLFLAVSKRRYDIVVYEETKVRPRVNIEKYNIPFLNTLLSTLGAITIIAYIMYTLSYSAIVTPGSKYLYVTSLFVMLGIFRYLQLTIVENDSCSPTRLLMHDRFLHVCIVGWILTFAILIYVF